MDFDADRLCKDGVEADLQVALADAPQFCGEGFRLVRREWPTDIGPVDLMCRDDEDGWIAVEIKRIGTIDAVEQLSRYLERIRLDPAKADCRGVLAAQIVKPQARVLAEARGLTWVEVDLAELRGEREPALTLFGLDLTDSVTISERRRRGRGARTGRCPARCRPRAGRRTGQRQRRAEQRGLDVGGHVVRALDRVGPVAARPRARPR